MRNEEEQVNQRPEPQANRKNKKPSQASHYRLAAYKHYRPLFVATRLPDSNLGQTNPLHHGPDNRETTGFRREGINLIGASSHIAKKAFNGIGTANMAMHRLGEGINEVGSQRVASPIDSEERFSKLVTL